MSSTPIIRDLTAEHHQRFLELNAEFQHWTAPMDAKELSYVLGLTDYARAIDGGAGVLIAYAHDSSYPNHKNLIWLRDHLSNFFYIDRVIVAKDAQGRGLGRLLYEDVAKFARARGQAYLACEVNTVPDNPASHRFHLQFGFEPIGEREFPDFGKSVRYYAMAL